MTIEELRAKVGNITLDRLTPVEVHGEAYLQARVKCEECDAQGATAAYQFSFQAGEIINLEQVGGRIILTVRD